MIIEFGYYKILDGLTQGVNLTFQKVKYRKGPSVYTPLFLHLIQ